MIRAVTLFVLLLLFLSFPLEAQTLKGKLFGLVDKEKEILPGASVQSIATGVKVQVNENGVFELPWVDITDKRIVASEIGYINDTIDVGDKTYLSIVLRPDSKSLKGITVKDTRAAYLLMNAIKTEVINQRELSKAACCDLAGCFGTQASVQPQTTNVLTNAQELRILGLSGVYNQLLVDGLPMISGAAYTYGVSTYPGTIVQNIYVSKGTNSVLQGFESISGQINLETTAPDKAELLYLNGYANSFGEVHLNANIAGTLGKKKKWHSLLAIHHVQPSGKIDGNKDGFLDLPQLTRYMAFNKWKYGNENQKGYSMQVALRLVKEKRVGGQMNYDDDKDNGSNTVYGQSVDFTQPEVSFKSSYRFTDKHAIALSLSGFIHKQFSWFGITNYAVQQQSAYANLQHEWQWHRTHAIKYGISYRYQRLNEGIYFEHNQLNRTFNGNYQTNLDVPGVFAENTFRWRDDKIVLIAGARVDKHQLWGGYFTPRTMLKYALNRRHTFRASVGSGWRQVNLFSEQINLLVGSRDVIFKEPLRPEVAINWGLNHVYRFELDNITGTLSADFYSTHFSNQFFPDYDADPKKILINNFTGISRSNGLQTEVSLIFFKQLEFRAAYNYLDVYRIQKGQKVLLPFNPRNRAMAAVSYRTKDNKWQGDVNAHWFDKMRLPNTAANPVEYRRADFSVPYATLNVQATFRWKNLDLYAGCENIFNYRQPNPIISANNPFSPYFDLSSVWGPTRGREFYLGVRWKVP